MDVELLLEVDQQLEEDAIAMGRVGDEAGDLSEPPRREGVVFY